MDTSHGSRVGMAQSNDLRLSIPDYTPSPWQDVTLTPQQRYDHYKNVVKDKCREIVAASQREGITPAERRMLKDDPDTQFWASELTRINQETPEEFCRRIDAHLADIAKYMLKFYRFNHLTRSALFLVPAGVTEAMAIKALNQYFAEFVRPRLPSQCERKVAIREGDIDVYTRLPRRHPSFCPHRNYTRPRLVEVIGVVPGTQAMTRAAQEEVLLRQSLVFADPRDQVLAAALHACLFEGEDLFCGFYVRGSAPNNAMETVDHLGIYIDGCDEEYHEHDIAASGSPLRSTP